jgi:hypothetical protein
VRLSCFQGGELGLDGMRRKSLAGEEFRKRRVELAAGEKLFGFLQFCISLCAITLCGQNGSGRAGRLWYTRSPAKHSAVKVRGCERRARRGTMPCIVIVKPVDADSQSMASTYGAPIGAVANLRHRVFGRRRPALIELFDSAAKDL